MRDRLHELWLSLRLLWFGRRRQRSSFAPTAVISVGIAVLVAYTVMTQLIHRPTIIDEITVPKTFADSGYTAAVASERLRDSIDSIEEDASRPPGDTTITGMAYVKATGTFAASQDLARERPSFVVPFVGLSTESVSSLFASLIHAHRFSGEFVVGHDDRTLSLTLRRDGKSFETLIGKVNDPDGLLRTAAQRIIELEHPSIVVASLCRSNPRKAIAEATAILARVDTTGVEEERIYVLRGRMLRLGRDLDGAEHDFRAALALNYDDAPAHNGLGNVFSGRRKWTEAMAEYKLAVRADPAYAAPYVNMGDYYSMKHDPVKAIEEYREAIRRDPKLVGPREKLAEKLADSGKRSEAIAAYREAIQVDPRDPALHINYGVLLDEDGNRAEEIEQYLDASRLDPSDPLPHTNLAAVYTDAGNRAGAAEEIRLARALEPRHVARRRTASMLKN